MAKSSKYGVFQRFKPSDLRRDTRSFFELYKELLTGSHGIYFMMGILCLYAVVLVMLPFGGEIFAVLTYFYLKKYTHPNEYLFEWPFRAPMHSDSMDATTDITAMVSDEILGDPKLFLEYARNKREKLRGEGVTYHGRCQDTGNPVYSSNSDDRTHSIVLGTTGSGKTEYMLSNCANQHVQNSGYIFVDAKGDTKAQQDHFRLCNRFGRVEDLLTINFITSGRNMLRAQTDKMTNSMNQMSNTSSGMLIEFLINLLDDSGGGGGDMWKGRAIAFIASLTRVLVFLRDTGFLQLSPKVFTQYMELEALEELVYNHHGKYGQDFERVAEQLQGYIVSLPGYSTNPKHLKKQESKTREQHGFITMQLTKAINDLTFNYGHIFGVEHSGDIDIFDVVLNRRVLTIPLPALERAPDTLKMLGKLVIGSIKQMMAGSLGNRMEGLRRAIIDARPTNALTSFRLFLDEWGYIVIVGASVLPAQARSLNFAITFGAQTYEDIERGSKEEAAATWGNTTIKAIGRTTSGAKSATYELVDGFAGEEIQGKVSSMAVHHGAIFNRSAPKDEVTFQKERRVAVEHLASQHNGQFTCLLSLKTEGGKAADVKIVRMLAFYVAGKQPKFMRLNDLCPIFNVQKDEIYDPSEKIEHFLKEAIEINTLSNDNATAQVALSIREFEVCRLMNKAISTSSNGDLTESFLTQVLDGIRKEQLAPEGCEPGQQTIGVASSHSQSASKEQKHAEKIFTAHKQAKFQDQLVEKRKELAHFNSTDTISEQVKSGLFAAPDLDVSFNYTVGTPVKSEEETEQVRNISLVDFESYYDEIKALIVEYDLKMGPIENYKIFSVPSTLKGNEESTSGFIANHHANMDHVISSSNQEEIERIQDTYAGQLKQLLSTSKFSHECLSLDSLLSRLSINVDRSIRLRDGIHIGKKD